MESSIFACWYEWIISNQIVKQKDKVPKWKILAFNSRTLGCRIKKSVPIRRADDSWRYFQLGD